jgi:hypothetical protein
MALCPVIASTRLAKDKVVRSEELSQGAASDRIHGTGLEVNEHCARHPFASLGLVVVDVETLSLEVALTMKGAL